MNLRGASIDSMYSRIERVRGVAREVVEQVAEVDVGALAERDHVREADAARLGPVEHRGDERARLRDEGDLRRAARRCARSWRSGRGRGVSRPRQFGPEHAQQVRPRGVEHRLLLRGARARRSSRSRRACRARRARRSAGAPLSGGVQMTARSGAAAARRGCAKHRSPSSVACFGLTALDRARRSAPARRLRQTVAPTLPGGSRRRPRQPTRARAADRGGGHSPGLSLLLDRMHGPWAFRLARQGTLRAPVPCAARLCAPRRGPSRPCCAGAGSRARRRRRARPGARQSPRRVRKGRRARG